MARGKLLILFLVSKCVVFERSIFHGLFVVYQARAIQIGKIESETNEIFDASVFSACEMRTVESVCSQVTRVQPVQVLYCNFHRVLIFKVTNEY